VAYTMGDVLVESTVNGQIRHIQITNVLLVKNLKYNLISASRLERKGFTIVIKDGIAQTTKDGIVVLEASRNGNFIIIIIIVVVVVYKTMNKVLHFQY
jgi:hypothetical protein